MKEVILYVLNPNMTLINTPIKILQKSKLYEK